MTDRPDRFADEEAAEAAREARNIGGRPSDLEPDMPHDPAMDPVYEAGGGESEGFEMAEDELIEHAEMGQDGDGERPIHLREERDVEQGAPDGATYGEADREAVSEDLDDPDAR